MSDARYWEVENDQLIYRSNLYDPHEFADVLIFDVEIHHPAYRQTERPRSLGYIADRLDEENRGSPLNTECWTICDHKVYRVDCADDEFGERELAGKWELIAILTLAFANYQCKKDGMTPLDKDMRRMEGRGCDHPRRLCLGPEDIRQEIDKVDFRKEGF